MSRTLFGRTLVSRSAPRGYDPRSLLHPGPETWTGVRVGLFETSSDVNNCAARTLSLAQCLDDALVAHIESRYGGKAALLSQQLLYVSTDAPPAHFAKDKALFEAWRKFFVTFRAWKQDWDDSWVSILSADAYRQCERYDLEAKDWHTQFEKHGVDMACRKTTTPGVIPGIDPPTPPDGKTPEGALDKIVTIVKWTALGAGALGVLFLVSR